MAPPTAPATGRVVSRPTPRGATATRRHLPRPARRALLVVHVLASGVWLGIDVVLAVLVLTALFGADPALAALCLQVLALLYWPMLITAVVCLLSGIGLGIGTRWGLVRYVWVAVKLVITLILVTLIVTILPSALAEAVAAGTAGGPNPAAGLDRLVMPPAVSLTALVVATVLSVVKPWGRMRNATAAPTPTNL